MSEITKTALITAYDKDRVPELADALWHKLGYRIVSLGGTAEVINDADIPVTQTERFLGELSLNDGDTLPLRTVRELDGAYLGQLLALEPEELGRLGWPVINFAYINLMPPKVTEDESGIYGGLRTDKGGINLINAAIEGGRHVLVQPSQIPATIDTMSKLGEIGSSDDLAFDALKYLEQYNYRASELLGNLELNIAQR